MKPLTQIRPLNLDDIPACLDLAANRQWSREPEKWRFLLTSGEGYGIDAPDGGLAATATLVRFGDEISVTGMVLVIDSLEGGLRIPIAIRVEPNSGFLLEPGFPAQNWAGYQRLGQEIGFLQS